MVLAEYLLGLFHCHSILCCCYSSYLIYLTQKCHGVYTYHFAPAKLIFPTKKSKCKVHGSRLTHALHFSFWRFFLLVFVAFAYPYIYLTAVLYRQSCVSAITYYCEMILNKNIWPESHIRHVDVEDVHVKQHLDLLIFMCVDVSLELRLI